MRLPGSSFGLALFAAVVTGGRRPPARRRSNAVANPDASLRPAPVLDMPCFAGDVSTAARAVVERAHARKGGYVCLCNVHVLVLAQSDAGVREALEHAWAVLPDGWPVAWLQRRTGVPDAERIAGMELLTEVFELGSEAKLRHFLFGSSPEVLARMQTQLAASFPEAEIAGGFSPPFGGLDEVDFAPAVAAIRAASPHIVWCGLGAPKQELWMQRHARQIAPAVVLGVGAAFDFAAGTKRRAPHWAQEHGMEWLHRLGSEPRRLIGRYASTGFMFVWYAGAWLVRGRPARASASR
jgi:N-acetylglucosaminyldiphosphoundecaprenol N-acetyl-beta-D-mannosaminyltransferase